MTVEKMLVILKGRMRENAEVFKMLTDCYCAGVLPVLEQRAEITAFSDCVSVVHEAILLQVYPVFDETIEW
jgi:hypothetical protein